MDQSILREDWQHLRITKEIIKETLEDILRVRTPDGRECVFKLGTSSGQPQ